MPHRMAGRQAGRHSDTRIIIIIIIRPGAIIGEGGFKARMDGDMNDIHARPVLALIAMGETARARFEYYLKYWEVLIYA